MYMKLQIFTQEGTLKILEQKDTPPRECLYDFNGVCVKSIHGPEIMYWNTSEITFYIRGDDRTRDFAVVDYGSEIILHKILKALATIASVDIIWS